jgi:hypothetical protein
VKGLLSMRRSEMVLKKLDLHNNSGRKKTKTREKSLSGECFVLFRTGSFTKMHQSSTKVKQCQFFNVLQP